MREEAPMTTLVPDDDTEMYGVSKGGWYLFNDNYRPVSERFGSREECEKARRKWARELDRS